MAFNNWNYGETNNDWNGNTTHCLELNDDKWSVQNCNEKRKFICESQ